MAKQEEREMDMMYAKILKSKCIACGVCESIASPVFEEDEDGYFQNKLLGDNNEGTTKIEEEELQKEVELARDSCAVEAIVTSDKPLAEVAL